MKQSNIAYPIFDGLGFLGAWLFVILVTFPMIIFFVCAAMIEYANTRQWYNVNVLSKKMGKLLEWPTWHIRSLSGILPIDPPSRN